jgi:putative ABC transport system permease protein
VSLDPSAHIADVIRAIDSRFANSTHETKTYTEGMIMREIAERFANIEGVSSFIALSVFLTVVLVTLQTMMQSLRERSGEIAVLRTLGFSRRRISRLLIGESLLLAGVSGGIGLGLAYLLIQAVRAPLALYLPYFGLTSSAVASAAVAVLALGLIAVAYPAIRALRIPIADALRAG